MALDITTIGNQKLREVAEKADSQGQNSYNNKLDSSELSVFVKEAYKEEFNYPEIAAIIEQVGVDEKDDQTKETLAKMKELFKMRNEIALKETTLAEKVDVLWDKKLALDEERNTSGIGGFLGLLGGAYVGSKLLGFASKVHPIAAMIGGLLAIGGAAVGGAYLGNKIEEEIRDTHTTEVMQQDLQNYEKGNIEPLKAEIQEMEEQLKQKEKEFKN